MLVLTRKLNEQIVIAGGEITIRVVDVRGSRVRLGIEAPQHVRIERQQPDCEQVERSQDRELVTA
jgi:carbon storage regulator